MGLNKFLQPPSPAPKLLLLLVLTCIVGAAFALAELKDRSNHSQATADLISQLKAAMRPTPKPSRAEEERREQWEKLQAERNFDWYPLFRALEQAAADDVELLEFRPDKVSRQLILRGEARDMKALTNYLERLSRQKSVSQAYLSLQKKSLRDGVPVISFEIQAALGIAAVVPDLQH